MQDSPRYTRHAEIVRAMRPFQRIVADLIIEDVIGGKAPSSLDEAKDRYRQDLGDGFLVDDGNGWRDDIRDTSIHCLIENGFSKGKVVTLDKNDGGLTSWVQEFELLTTAAKLEYEAGGNRNVATYLSKLKEECYFLGEGREAVYVYTDSRLDELGGTYCKIGRHLSSEIGSIATRVLSQYGTGSAGMPILRYAFKSNNAVSLETRLHHSFVEDRAKDAFGEEWFKIDHKLVLERFLLLNET